MHTLNLTTTTDAGELDFTHVDGLDTDRLIAALDADLFTPSRRSDPVATAAAELDVHAATVADLQDAGYELTVKDIQPRRLGTDPHAHDALARLERRHVYLPV